MAISRQDVDIRTAIQVIDQTTRAARALKFENTDYFDRISDLAPALMKLQDSAYMRSIQQQAELAATMAANLKVVSFVTSPETIKAIENFGQRVGPYLASFENSDLHKAMIQSVELATQMAKRLEALSYPVDLSSIIKPEYLDGIRNLVDFANRIAPVKDVIEQRQVPSIEALADAIEGIPDEEIADQIKKTFPAKTTDSTGVTTTTSPSSISLVDWLQILALILSMWSDSVNIGLLPKTPLATKLLDDIVTNIESVIREHQKADSEHKDLSCDRISQDGPSEIERNDAPDDLTPARLSHSPSSTLI